MTTSDAAARRFRIVLAVDAVNVLLLALRAGRGTGRSVVGVAALGWLAAVRADIAARRGPRSHAARWIRAGMVFNAAGSGALIVAASRRARPSLGSSVYLLIGGTAISFAYLRVLRGWHDR